MNDDEPERSARDVLRDTSIVITVEGLNDLTVGDVWPDGDAPKVPTAADVVEAMGTGTVVQILRDWNLDVSLHVTVDAPNPHYTQPNALFPELAPEARYITSVEVG